MRAIILGAVLLLAVSGAEAMSSARRHPARRAGAATRRAKDEAMMRAALRDFGLHVLNYRRGQEEDDWEVSTYAAGKPGEVVISFFSGMRKWSANTQHAMVDLWLTEWRGAWTSAGGDTKRCAIYTCCDDGLPFPE